MQEGASTIATTFRTAHQESRSNAVNSYFKTSTSLVYHYLDEDEDSIVLGKFNIVEQVTLLCGFCNRAKKAGLKGWNVNLKARGSTTNFSNHMQKHHPRAWDEIVKLDKAATSGGEVTESNASETVQQWLNEKVCFVFYQYLLFNNYFRLSKSMFSMRKCVAIPCLGMSPSPR
jgi:hypothetical protein